MMTKILVKKDRVQIHNWVAGGNVITVMMGHHSDEDHT